MPSTSFPDAAVLAAFISNVLAGWAVLIVIGGALLLVIAVGAWTLGRNTRPAPKHGPGWGRRAFEIPTNARPRTALHCRQTAAAETALLPAIAPVYLGPPIETTQRLPQVHRVTTGATR